MTPIVRPYSRSLPLNFEHENEALVRPPSPFLPSDFSFREDFLIDHYFDYHFVRQFTNRALKTFDVPSRQMIEELSLANPALRHAICALAATSLPSPHRSLENERLAHLGMSLAFLRRRLMERRIDEGMLLAIIELTDLDVLSLNQRR
jgi:hypothetical protein